ncbi:TetR/AcrR family transcriptional regulator [Nocardia wallacei]|uniref:TetR/AcrR family transcriptional regulator n=1 Tax=Nocardia wallacei TaxID=480035 RepID=UPI002456697C|nr:helix-turn-helix domain-containing protein [Nocardia wallacei]
MTARSSHPPRSDARDNRARILDAARTVFITDGLDVPIREIAHRAEVGPATVYRHFPTKQMLATEAFTAQLRTWQSVMAKGLADPDPWHGFCRTVENLCALRASDHAFTAAFKSTYPRAMNFSATRASSLTSAAELIRRARTTGHLRPDVVPNDLALMLMATDGLRPSSPADTQRFATHIIRAFRAGAHPSLPEGSLRASTPR